MDAMSPVEELVFTIENIAGFDSAAGGDAAALSHDTLIEILTEADRFAEQELVEADRNGDRIGATFANGRVTTAPGWPELYRRWRAGGWAGLAAPQEFGGQGLPIIVHAAIQEIWNAGSASFATGAMLLAGAIDALSFHASPDLKARFLPSLVSGEWMATMDLTEPAAGSDLGAIATRAEPAADGSWRIFGEKIFITYGDHDLTPNIIHLVLARAAGAPQGTAGLSLFVVPKMLGTAVNDMAVARIERKLGLHGTPTCAMVYGGRGEGATGWLVGDLNRGLAAMFAMMNFTRMNVAIQGIGVAERSFRDALAYARLRRQGSIGGIPVAIAEHPDVQAMLVRMQALTAAARALAYSCAYAIDRGRAGGEDLRGVWSDRAALLTPVAKAFATDAGIEVANLGIQVHGGAGYIEDTGAAQRLRDARIFAIYEGTNGIQAIDLVVRKLPLRDGRIVEEWLQELRDVLAAVRELGSPALGNTAQRLAPALAQFDDATRFMLVRGRNRVALAAATPYCRLFGLVSGAVLLAKGALHEGAAGGTFTALARYFAECMLGEAGGLHAAISEGAPALDQAASMIIGGDRRPSAQGAA